jgi:hypothetical protein
LRFSGKRRKLEFNHAIAAKNCSRTVSYIPNLLVSIFLNCCKQAISPTTRKPVFFFIGFLLLACIGFTVAQANILRIDFKKFQLSIQRFFCLAEAIGLIGHNRAKTRSFGKQSSLARVGKTEYRLQA